MITEMSYKEILWHQTEYKLKFVVDNPNFNLPQVVRVVQGHMVDEDDALASGQILTLHGKKKIDKLIGSDDHGKELNIPLNCPYKIKVVQSDSHQPRVFSSISEIVLCETSPKFLKTGNEVLTCEGNTFLENTTIEIIEHLLAKTGEILGITCRIVNQDKPVVDNQEKVITLPINFIGQFTEVTSTDILNKRYLLADAVEEFGLPVKMQFLPVTERNCGYGPHLGILTLKGKVSNDSILATAFVDGIRYAMTFSIDLPVTIQIAMSEVELQDYGHRSNIDLAKFDYLDSDPYSSVAIKNKVYDELRTPRPLTRRNHSYKNTSSSSINTPIFERKTTRKEKPGLRKRSKSQTDFEKLIKSKFGLKSLKRSVSKLKDRGSKERVSSHSSSIEFDTHSTCTYGTSEDGNSSTGACSIDVTSNDSTFNGSFQHIIDCMDALSMSHNIDSLHNSAPSNKRHSRKSSGDSGICLTRKQQRSRSIADSKSQNSSDMESCSECNLNMKRSPISMSTVTKVSSSNYLWSAQPTSDSNNNKDDNTLDYDKHFIPNATSELKSVISSTPINSVHNDSIEMVRALHEDGVNLLLEDINLCEFQTSFRNNQINGELLVCLDKDELVNELKLSLFQAKKILCYVKGWRPQREDFQTKENSRRNSLNPRDWSENDVYTHLNTINLNGLGEFCRLNQVNGELLLEILDKETLLSLQADHGVKMSSLESKKLLNFVVRGWRPDSSPKKTAAAV